MGNKRIGPRMCAGGIEQIADPSKVKCLGVALFSAYDRVKKGIRRGFRADTPGGTIVVLMHGDTFEMIRAKKGNGIIGRNMQLLNAALSENKYYLSNVIVDHGPLNYMEHHKEISGYKGTLYREK